MSDRERTIAAGAEALVSFVLCLIGLLLTLSGSLAVVGFALIVLGGLGLGHSLALGVGLVSYPSSEDAEDRDDD